MFDFGKKSKEYYWRKARAAIRKMKSEDLLEVDQSKFGIIKPREDSASARVYFNRFKKEKNIRRWQKLKKELPALGEVKVELDGYGEKTESIFIHGYIDIPLKEKDRWGGEKNGNRIVPPNLAVDQSERL